MIPSTSPVLAWRELLGVRFMLLVITTLLLFTGSTLSSGATLVLCGDSGPSLLLLLLCLYACGRLEEQAAARFLFPVKR